MNEFKYVCCFGKSCIGKSTVLSKDDTKEILFKSKDIRVIDVDRYMWKVYSSIYGDTKTNELISMSRTLIYDTKKTAEEKKKEILNSKYFTQDFWDKFFNEVTGKVLDWAFAGFYYDIIPEKYRNQMYFVEFVVDEKTRQIYSKLKGFEQKINMLDSLYILPKTINNRVNVFDLKYLISYNKDTKSFTI